MPGSSNLKQWNPASANQQTDTQYNADTMRAGGAVLDAILPSPTFNKFAYQVSTLCAALGQAMAAKGYTISDANLANLVAALGNIMTQADMAPYALLASPALTGTPTAPTPNDGDVSTKLATTAFIYNALVNNLAVIAEGAGYGCWKIGSRYLQFVTGSSVYTSGNNSQTLNWPMEFPNECRFALPGTLGAINAPTSIMTYWITGVTKSQVSVYSLRRGDNGANTIQPVAIGVGY